MDDVALGQEEFGQIRAVLSRNSSNQGFFHIICRTRPLLLPNLRPASSPVLHEHGFVDGAGLSLRDYADFLESSELL